MTRGRVVDRRCLWGTAVICAAWLTAAGDCRGDDSPKLDFRKGEGFVEFQADGVPVLAYHFEDPKIPRPYFAHVKLPSGAQVTRNHPPQEGDAKDHDLLHPGIWFALGDINGQDNWRLKAPVKGGEFIEEPSVKEGRGTFVVRNRYFANNSEDLLLTEECRYTFVPRPTGLLLLIDSTLTGNVECKFGDGMEELGLGVRLATPIAVKSGQGGTILNNEGRTGEAATRERLADWCDYSGMLGEQKAGITIFGAPENPRKIWWHTRDYGFFAANPFHSHPDRSDNSPLILTGGEAVRFRYGVAIHGDRGGVVYEPGEEYKVYLEMLSGK